MIQAVKNGQFSARAVYLHFGIANSDVVSWWLQAFKHKTEEESLKYRILELETENAILKKVVGTQPTKNAAISQKISTIYYDNDGNYCYRCVMFKLRETIKINHKKSATYYAIIGA